MKKIIVIMMMLLLAVPVSACPAWECNYGLDDYSCGGYHGCSSSSYNYDCDSYNYDSGSYNCYEDSYNCDYDSYNYSSGYGESCNYYDEYSTERQPIYCQYCGNESWCCTCGSNYNYDYDCGYGYQQDSYGYGYDCGYQEAYYDAGCYNGYSGESMNHWANVRDCYGNIIGQVNEGSCVEVVGIDHSDCDRVYIYDYATGTYGSVLSECVYGNYQWDGTGDNGYYNSYQGDNCGYEDYGNYSSCTGNYNYGCGSYEAGCDYNGYYDNCGYYDDCNYSNGGYGRVGTGCNAYSSSYYVTYCETVVQRCVTYGFGGGFGGCYL